jgi:hypothetical protein
MPDVNEARRRNDIAPRWSTLLGLGLAVLVAHLWLLTDGLPSFIAPAASTLPEASASKPVQPPNAVAETPKATAPARISQIRWIVPSPPAVPAPALREETPRPPVVRRPPARADVPKPIKPVVEPVAEAPAPEPTPGVPAPADEQLVQAPVEEAGSAPMPAAAAETAAPVPEPSPPPAAPAPPTVAAAAPAAERILPPAQPPASTRLQYVVTGQARGFHYNATGTLDWELTGDRYSARMEMRMPLLGARVQTSTGAVGPEGLMPERFADKGRSERAAHFEREQRRIRFSANTPEAEWLPGAQDRLSLFMQIAGLLQANPQAYPAGHLIDMQVAGTGDAEIWRFQVGEESLLALPAGEMRVRHLVRQPRKEFDSTVEMWLAPDLNHLPVRLRVTQANGDMADQQLSEKP